MSVLERTPTSDDVTGAARPPRASATTWLVRLWHVALVVGPSALLAYVGHGRRWISDDGLIVVRAAKMILAGHGPVYNVGERAEASTSVIWTWLVAAAGLSGLSLAKLAVWGGLALSVLGFALALDGTRRLYRPAATWLVPAGAFVPLALTPFWDFTTSGLETGLMFGWLGLSWWLLVRLDRTVGTWWRYVAAFVFGLGELVRPDLGVATIGFGVAAWLATRPSRRQSVALLATAFAVPVAYQIFRMGYYGMIVPNTAIAKEAQTSHWSGGWVYLEDFVSPYRLWIPAVLLALAVVAAWWRRSGRPAPAAVVAPLTAAVVGVLLAGYIVKVGGDFMHARMLLPAVFCLLLPVMLLPVQSLPARIPVLVLVAAVAVWSVQSATGYRPPVERGAGDIGDEREYWIFNTGDAHPTTEADYRGQAYRTPHLEAVLRTRQLVYPTRNDLFQHHTAPLRYHQPTSGGLIVGVLGIPSTHLPTDALAIDYLGLAYPLASHATLEERSRAGHHKAFPIEWTLADYTPDDFVPSSEVDLAELAAARRALRCGDIAELQRAVRDPMTADRFRRNLFGAFSRTFMRFPVDPVEAERKYCQPRQ